MSKKAEQPHYEFGGPVGAFMTMLNLPLVILMLYSACTEEGCGLDTGILQRVPASVDGLWSWKSFAAVVGWLAWNVMLFYAVPGPVVNGTKIPATGKPLPYKLNGFRAMWPAVAATLFFDLSFIYDDYIKLATAMVAVSTCLAVYLYASSFKRNAVLADGGHTGNPIYDFYIGRELNPRIGKLLDLKELCELRPGLIGWAVINLGIMQKQYQLRGHVTPAMIAVNLLQGLYVVDALYFEKAILTTMDITTDGFGFMLAFGDLAWVPFAYTLQARYMVAAGPDADPSFFVLCVAIGLSLLGYTIFRLSNYEKDVFRTDPKDPRVAHLKTLPTSVPDRKLLVSGWWGLARKINYTGDWIQGLGWSLLTGTSSVLPYFYPIYFFVLLVHRAFRDDEACTRKYGVKVWAEYKAKVPYIFIPYVI